MSPGTRPVGVWAWTRLAVACFASALLLSLGSILWGGYGLDVPGSEALALGIRAAVGTALAVLVLGGVAAAVLAVVTALRSGAVPPPALDRLLTAGTLPARRRVAVAAPFAVVNLGVIAAGVAHILVWNPLARVPGRQLSEIYEQMYAVGEGTGAGGLAAAWAGFWGLATIAYAVTSALPIAKRFFTARRIGLTGLVLIGGTAGLHWIAGFSMGMSLADAFGTSGGDAAWSGPAIALTGQAALIAALFTALVGQRPAVPPAVPATAIA